MTEPISNPTTTCQITRTNDCIRRRASALTLATAVLATFMVGTGHKARAQADHEIGGQLQAALEATVASDETQFPGAILYISHPIRGTWAKAAGVADIETGKPLTPDAKFRAGSIMKPFIATVVLQLVEEGVLSLDDTLTELLPDDVTLRFSGGDEITLRMLLGHTSGIPDWLSGPVIERIAANQSKVWEVSEFLDLAAAQQASFAPGEGWAYSNTNYNLLGLIIERATSQSWRDAIRARVVERLGLGNTSLPEPGNVSIDGAFMHGYGLISGKVVDLSYIDPSMAGAAGGGALVTTVGDLAAFMASLRDGMLFKAPETFGEMVDFVNAPNDGGQVGYGLGLEKYELAGGVVMIGHSGGTAGYRSFAGYVPELELDIALVISVQGDPTPVIFNALEVMVPGLTR